MKNIKKILYLTLIAVISLVIGYFITSYTQFNGSIEQEVFKYGFYRTKDNNGFVSFGSFKNSVICFNDYYYFISNVEYDKGIFTLQNRDNEEIYKLGVVDENTIYSSDFNTYFYNITLFSEE